MKKINFSFNLSQNWHRWRLLEFEYSVKNHEKISKMKITKLTKIAKIAEITRLRKITKMWKMRKIA